ncbi:MAG TPA: hypothetical protein VEA99_04605, partial [Gemmatimonadaceae bacterium]|nr:hypothetical protein [Gemmatimonadaceae bacterium]
MRPRLSLAILLLAGAAAAACRPASPPAPEEEFLVVAGDSTHWVRAGRAGLRVRGAPLTLARVDGRFQEVFVVDDDRSFENAVFVAPLVYRRDLVTGDSAVVWRDSTFEAQVARYATEHPSERLLDDDEPAPEEPRVSNSAEFGLIELHGPYLSYEYHLDVDTDDTPAWHSTRRGVVDLRGGGDASLATLFGETVARRVLGQGRRAYLAVLDSIMLAESEGARRAARALGAFRFDGRSFGLADLDGAPAVAFHAPGRGDGTVGSVTLPLAPIPVREPRWWQREVRPEMPSARNAAERERWTHGANTIEARYDSLAESAELVLVDGRGHEWRLARVGAPVYRIHWLGQSLDSV